MRKVALCVGLILCLACGFGQPETPTEPAPSEAASIEERAARVADAIKNSPGSIDQALAEQGFTPESFESTMFEIAADPLRTKAFLSAKHQ